MIFAAAISLMLLASGASAFSPPPHAAAKDPILTASLEVGAAVGVLTPDSWSVDAQVTNPNALRVDPSVGQYLNASGNGGIGFVRYGAGADECNETTNQFYNSSGVVISGCPNNVTAIKDWCDSLTPTCRTVLDLPGENNNSAEDAAIVRDIVDTKGFLPTYFAIGNEPESWTHYGEPWTSWRTTDHSTPTPLDYAWDVHDAIAAIRGVDPDAQFVGIEADGSFDVSYPTAVLQLNAPNISAMAVHLYPHAPGTFGGAESLPLYLEGLYVSSPGLPSPAAAYEKFRATVTAACANCSRIVVQVGEFNSGPAQGPPPNENMEYAGAVYLAAGAVELLDAGAPIIEVYKLQGGQNPCDDCLMNSTAGDALDPQGQFLEEFPPMLGGGAILNSTVVSSATNLWATTVSRAGNTSLLFVNANVTAPSVVLNLTGSLIPTGHLVRIRTWTSTGPIETTTALMPTSISVPSLGILAINETPNASTIPPSNTTSPGGTSGTRFASLQITQVAGLGVAVVGAVLLVQRAEIRFSPKYRWVPPWAPGLALLGAGIVLLLAG